MSGKEPVKRELEQELEWVKYRTKMLDIIEEKLLQMKKLAEQAKGGSLSSEEVAILNDRLNKLAVQINALDEESRK